MEHLFRTIWDMSLVGSYCILLVLLVRFVLRKAPRWYSYALWAIVFLRLICPVFPESGFSLIPQRLTVVESDNQIQEEPAFLTGVLDSQNLPMGETDPSGVPDWEPEEEIVGTDLQLGEVQVDRIEGTSDLSSL